MAKPINLNKARKAKSKTDKAKRADENRVKFGQTKPVRDLEKARAAKATKALEDNKLET